MKQSFRMKIVDVFSFDNGSTVFAGDVTEGPCLLPRGLCSLFVNGQHIGDVNIITERSLGRVQSLRSIETIKQHPFDINEINGREINFVAIQ